MPYIEHKYGKTYFQSRGSRRARGTPIVCLHGGPGGHSYFMQDLFRLSDERRVFIYDQLGGGRSSSTSRSRWNIRTFVKELHWLVEAWELDEFHLFGASWGTTLALEYYLSDRRKRVRSMTLQSPMFSAADWQNDANQLIRALPANERKIIRYCHEIGATDARVYEDAMSVYYARHVLRNKAAAKRRTTFKNTHGGEIYAHMWGASEFSATGTLRTYDRVKDLASVQCPSLVICGEHDEARPRTGQGYARRMPDARFKMIPNASHAILAERPAALIKTIRNFLDTVEPE